jgi:hypothetical protein
MDVKLGYRVKGVKSGPRPAHPIGIRVGAIGAEVAPRLRETVE